MKVSLRRTGGFANITMKSEVDAAQLGEKDAAELRRLVGSLPKAQPQRAAAAGPVADAFQYEVTIDDGSGPRTYRGSDGAMPKELQKLVDWLAAK